MHCYHPIIRRNTPLPLTRTEQYSTSYPYQEAVDVQVYQGEDDDALRDILVGDFRIEGLTPMPGPNELLCRMRLDLDGVLEVAAVEKSTGKSKQITIANAMRVKSPEEIAAGRKRVQEMYASRAGTDDEIWETAGGGMQDEEELAEISMAAVATIEAPAPAAPGPDAELQSLLERSRGLLGKMHAEDREEAIDLHEKIESASASGDIAALHQATRGLKELLFFVEGQG
jgi:molecular chaperone DnaK (HSP70)